MTEIANLPNEQLQDSALFLVDCGKDLENPAKSAGWRTVSSDSGDGAEAAFLASGAMVVLVDARADWEKAVRAAGRLSDAVELNAAAMLVVFAEGMLPALGKAVDAGATHYLAAPFDDTEFLQSLRLAERHATRLSGNTRLVERRRKAETVAVVSSLGRRDPLTGLYDAMAARRWIEAHLSGNCRILLIKVTRFDMINSAFGREIGDDLLRSVARLIGPLAAELGGSNAIISRAAGAEFVIGLDKDVSEAQAILLAKSIAEHIERPMLSGPHLVTLASRICIVERDDSDVDAAHLLRRASAALVDISATDQDRIQIVSRDNHSLGVLDQSLQSDLRNALDRNEIELLFQPQVSISSGKIVGVEALARWRHPTHGELGAATLFAVAERSDYLLALSAHVQRLAMERALAWPDSLTHLRMAVNITSTDIARPDFAENFLAMVDASGFPRGRLTVEVTESGLIEDLNAAASLLAALRAGGCRVAIDDFGTGYSSLAYLKALPLDYLKIDKKLAQDIAGSTRDRIVVRGVIDMARSLGLAVIAEGVETEEQLALLAREGCNYYQGFLCAEPVDVAALERLITQQD